MYLFFDTETTGLPRNWQAPLEDLNNWPRLVQIAWLLFDDNNQEIARANYIVRPEGFAIPEAAAQVHGITTEKALSQGEDLSLVLSDFSAATRDAKIIIAHNMSFDEKIAGAEFLRKEIEHELFTTPRFCTMQASTDFCAIPGNYGYKWPSLSELHIKLFKEDFPDAHDALVDVRACARCFFEMKNLGII